jgi:TolA-binding protein
LPLTKTSTQPPRVPTSSEPARVASADFGCPMAALDRGDNRAAAEGFARFLRDHPGDARAEDAAYLRVIALQRCGDHNGVRAAGLEYLRRFPAGFRRSEVEMLSR